MPIASAGKESVTRLIKSKCTGSKGTGNAIRDVYNTAKIPAVFPESRNCTALMIFRYTFLPFATALMIVAKLSSARIIDAASLETSVPVIPIATPISAFFNAGASFTPSPVIATILPFRCHASTIRILFSGDNLAYTEIRSNFSSSSVSGIPSSCAPVIARSPSLKIPICFAIAVAVI